MGCLRADMTQLPEIITTDANLSQKEEIASLRAELYREQEARIEAETALLMVDIAQENGDPPPSRIPDL